MKPAALILTHNEAPNIEACLAGLAPVERIVVIDSGSSDATLDLLRAAGGVDVDSVDGDGDAVPTPRIVIDHRPFVSFSDQRNYGMERHFASGDWVLHLDADERLTPSLWDEILEIRPAPEKVAYNIPSMTFHRGRAIPRATGFPVYQTRLTRADFRFVEVGHGQKAPPEIRDIPRLGAHYEHHPFRKGMSEWILRHNRYSTLEAREWHERRGRYTFSAALRDPIARRQWLKQIRRHVPFSAVLTYIYLALIRGGILDGRAGLDYCRMRAIYETMILLKVRELEYLNAEKSGE